MISKLVSIKDSDKALPISPSEPVIKIFFLLVSFFFFRNWCRKS